MDAYSVHLIGLFGAGRSESTRPTVRSIDKAIEVQTEFAKTAYETFVTESQKIGALYGDLARQSYKPFGGLVAKMTPTNR